MIENASLWGILLGSIVNFFYFILAVRNNRRKVELSQTVVLLLSSVGIVTGANLGLTSIFETKESMGVLVDQRIPILIGAIAICWVSVAEVFRICKFIYQKDEAVSE